MTISHFLKYGGPVKKTGAPPIDQLGARPWANFYTERGYAVVPLRRKSKKLLKRNLPRGLLRVTEIDRYFSREINLGLRFGELSGGLIDIDLDAPEAIAIATTFLPRTDMRHGRRGKPGSHFWYQVTGAVKTERFCDVDGTVLAEIRSTGSVTMVPPSLHPTGERLEWDAIEAPTRVTADALRAAVMRLAAAALVARHWPKRGSRHDASLALAGFLLRGVE